MTASPKPVIVLGAGGHAKVLVDALRATQAQIIGLVTPAAGEERLWGLPILGDDDAVRAYPPDEVHLVNGVGTVPGRQETRRRLYDTFCSRGYHFRTVIHPAAILAADVTVADGVQIMAGCVLQPSVRVGHNTIVNTRASIDHDCDIGAHVHIAPGVTMSGNVRVETGAHLGTGASVIDGVTIGQGAIIGVGAAVFKDIAPGQRVLARCEIRP